MTDAARIGHSNVHETQPIVLIGGSGFIGSSILRELLTHAPSGLRVLTRHSNTGMRDGRFEYVAGDLSDCSSLKRVLVGAGTVINAGTYVGPDRELAEKVNHQGVLNLLSACKGEGVERVIQLSTTAVYGTGPHRGEAEEDLPYAPASAVSASRAYGDRSVLQFGGICIRPNLVIGRGDRWVLPALVNMVNHIGGLPGGGLARVSVIQVDDLGSLIAKLAVESIQHHGALHAAYSHPFTVRDLFACLITSLSSSDQTGRRSLALDSARLLGAGFSQHQIDLVTKDHWYASRRLFHLTGLIDIDREVMNPVSQRVRR